MTPTRTARFGLLVLALAGGFPPELLATEPAHKPRHAVPRTARAAPDVTATIAKPPMPRPPKDPAADDRAVPPPFLLPTASRARVRACGETWRDMKLAGTTGDDNWREFAQKCFVGKDLKALAN